MGGWTRWAGNAAIACACACASEDAARVADCDEDAVVPLLVTDGDEYAQLVGRADEAWVFEVNTYATDFADIVAGDAYWPPSLATRIVAVDGCGAEPRVVAEGLLGVTAPPRAGLPWLARVPGDGLTSGLYRIDPLDGAPPERIASDPDGRSLWVEDGLVALDGAVEDPSTLVRIEFLADGRLQKTALREDVHVLASSVDASLVYTRVAFVSTDHELFVHDVATGVEQRVREETMSLLISFDPESRALVFSAAEAGPLRVIETDGMRELQLLHGEDSAGLLVGLDYVGTWSYTGETIVESQIMWLPEVSEFRAPGRWHPRGGSPDGAIRMLEGPDAIHRLDAGADEPVRVRAGAGYAGVFDDRIWLAEEVGPSQMRLVRMQLDGSGADDLLGLDVAGVRQLDGDRWVYTTELDERGLGDLEAIDLATGERETLLDSVTKILPASSTTEFVDDSPNDALAHRITPDDPDGNGVWLVHTDRL